MRCCEAVQADGEIKEETMLNATQTNGHKLRRFVKNIRFQIVACVAANKPKKLIEPLIYTQRNEGPTVVVLSHVVNVIPSTQELENKLSQF